MSTAEGVVEVINHKKAKNYTLTSFRLEGVDKWFSAGFKFDDNFSKGDEISFTYKFNKDYKSNEVDLSSVEIITPASNRSDDGDDKDDDSDSKKPARASSGGSRKSSGGGASPAAARDTYWTDKAEEDKKTQLRISFSWATSTAIELLKVFREAGGEVAIGGTKKKQLGTFLNEVALVRDKLLQEASDLEYIKSCIANKPELPAKAPRKAKGKVEETDDGEEESGEGGDE